MRNVPATVYRLREYHDSSEVFQQLDGYRDEIEVSEVDVPLVTTIEGVENTERGVSFTVEYDYVQSVRQRERDDPLHVKGTRSIEARFCKGIASDGFILAGSEPKIASKRISKAIEGDEDASVLLKIAPTTIATVVSMDSEAARYQIWEDIDVFTNMASIQGKVKDSTYSQDFDEYGRPVWAMFDSQYLGETVGVSQSGFVIYGSDIQSEDIESYYFNVLKDAIES